MRGGLGPSVGMVAWWSRGGSRSVGTGGDAELATYVVEKGEPFLVVID